MDAKAERVALFRYGLIAPLVLESLPRGELTRRAQEIDPRYVVVLSGWPAAGNCFRASQGRKQPTSPRLWRTSAAKRVTTNSASTS